VQGAAEPFYTTPEEGEEFSLAAGSPFCRAIATGGCRARPAGRQGRQAVWLAALRAQHLQAFGCATDAVGCAARWQPPYNSLPACWPPLAAAATMKKDEKVKLVVNPECECCGGWGWLLTQGVQGAHKVPPTCNCRPAAICLPT
jgi:hypothetical protein